VRKIRKGDEVIVLAGKDKGKRGHVLHVVDDERVIVENINMVRRHTKPNPHRDIGGGIVEKEAPLHVSKVALFNRATDKPDRVGFKTLEDGRKVRYFKSTGEVVDT
jgi:large subunit ribosomal protein L24